MHANAITALFCSLAHIFLQTDNSACILVLPNIKYAVSSYPFWKWDKVKLPLSRPRQYQCQSDACEQWIWYYQGSCCKYSKLGSREGLGCCHHRDHHPYCICHCQPVKCKLFIWHSGISTCKYYVFVVVQVLIHGTISQFLTHLCVSSNLWLR